MLKIDLVGADTETSNDAQLLGGIEDLLGQLCLGADADAVHILDLGDQVFLAQGLCECLDLVVRWRMGGVSFCFFCFDVMR